MLLGKRHYALGEAGMPMSSVRVSSGHVEQVMQNLMLVGYRPSLILQDQGRASLVEADALLPDAIARDDDDKWRGWRRDLAAYLDAARSRLVKIGVLFGRASLAQSQAIATHGVVLPAEAMIICGRFGIAAATSAAGQEDKGSKSRYSHGAEAYT